jgi:hypothetical protein
MRVATRQVFRTGWSYTHHEADGAGVHVDVARIANKAIQRHAAHSEGHLEALSPQTGATLIPLWSIDRSRHMVRSHSEALTEWMSTTCLERDDGGLCRLAVLA